MTVIANWHPVTHDFGLIHVPVQTAVDDLRTWHEGIGIRYERRDLTASLEAGFEALLPLCHGKQRRLFVSIKPGWTACFQNGIDGSDPFPAMSMLAERLNVLAMRVCSAPPNALWQGVAWEVYAPEHLGGTPPLMYRRAIYAIDDGGRWDLTNPARRSSLKRLAHIRRDARGTALRTKCWSGI